MFFPVFSEDSQNSSKMPRGKGFRRSQAAKRRNAERYTLGSFMDVIEVMPPLKQKAAPHSSDKQSQENADRENADRENAHRENCLNCRKAPENVPNSITNVPKFATSVAKSVPKSTKSVPKSATSVTKSVPKSATSVTKSVPKSVTSVPVSSKSWSDVTRASLVNNSGYFPQKVIRGSFHQGDARFGSNRNRQCAVNSITAVMTSVLKDVLMWTTEDLNAVLLHGDELYTSMTLQGQIHDRTGLGHISVAEMPRLHTLDNTTFSIKHGESFCGVIGVDVYDESLRDVSMSIEEALQRALLQYDACLLNIKHYICAVIKAGPIFALVDPHSRNGKGLPEPYGRSIILYCDDIYMLFNHVSSLALSLNAQGTHFEVTSVKATVIGKTTTIEASSKSGQEGSGEYVSHATTEMESKCIGRCGKRTREDKVASLTHVSSTSSEHNQDDLCTRLRLTNESIGVEGTHFGSLGVPCKTISIKSDGNCMFRSIAHSVCGNQEKHLIIRRAVVKHLEANSSKFERYLREEYRSVKDYLTQSKMNFSGTWGSHVELFCAADLLKINVMTFNDDRWNAHIPTEQVFTDNAIYLKHCNGNHYEVVTCVKHKHQENVCSKACNIQVDDQSTSRNLRKRKLNDTEEYSKSKRERQRYHSDSNFRQKKIENIRTKYCEDSDYRQKKIENIRTKYCEDSDYRQKKIENIRTKYCEDSDYRQKKIENIRKKYCEDSDFKEKKLENLRDKYKNNINLQQSKCERSKDKYQGNPTFKASVCEYSKNKYSKKPTFKASVCEYSKNKYSKNPTFKASVCEYSKNKYNKNPTFKASVREYSKKKYHDNENFRMSIIQKRAESSAKQKDRQKDIDFTINQFHQEVNKGPEFVCSVCHRLLFRKQVIECKRDCYKIRGQQITDLAERCITEKYLHICNTECENKCQLSGNPACKLWICYTCHRKILGGKLPEESIANNMHLVDIPKELKGLNSLEEHLIARNIPFMKLLCLPRGKQKGCHGPVVTVPVNTAVVSNILPRNECDDHMIKIKLKRKLTYKGHYEYKYVSTDRVRHALSYLVRHNKWYNDVEFNEQWINSLNAVDEVENCDDDFEMEEQDVTDKNEDDKVVQDDPEEDITYIKEQSGLLSDTSLQPVDLGSEIIDQHFHDVLNVAPAEGNSPIRLLSDKSNEAKCFPVLYPIGGPTFHDERPEKITLSRYLNARLLNADGRFAQSTDFIFYAQYLSELDQIVSNVSIALRKGSEKNCLKVTADMLTNSDSLKRILNYDEGYKFLRPVRGTPPYWMSTQKDLFALIRQLGIPTFFASFSSADLRWPEMLNTIIKQEGKQINVDELDWSEKCGLIRRNPVTAARMFDHRWHCFLKNVIMSPAKPIGEIKDYFYRVEFQQRGSPHVHCLFWVENAPKLNDHDADNDALVADFIDTYITCETPPENDTVLYETVNSVQKHSTRHSKTCRKKNTVCRFNFPRPPSSRTFITRETNADELKGKGEDTTASAIIKKVKTALNSDVNFDSVDAFFSSIGINQTMFEKAYNECSKKKSIVLKRNPKDVWVNQYNRDLMRAWQGNMDIQYVTDAFSVVVYILSYITKAEQEMGLLLQRAQNEAMNGNLEVKESLKQLGSIYLHNREISAQEAVYRLTGMHLKECSRKVQFIPIGQNPVKMSLPLHILQNKMENDQSDDESYLWMTSVTDRYKNRPEKEPLENLCLASFCSEYRVLTKSEVSSQKKTAENEIIKLNNNNGHVKRRTRTEPAVVRYPRFSPTKDPEKYYHSLLQLFFPHYDESDLKPSKYDTYEEFYNSGVIKMGSEVKQVKLIVDGNRALFEKESDKIDRAKQLLEQDIDLEDAWAQICPESEKQRDECIELMKDKLLLDEDDSQELIPDLTANPQTVCTIETNHTTMPREEALHLLRSLNEEQSAVFYKVRKWCLQKLLGQNPEPFRLFLTGGAGTGKSHLIKAIQYESCRLLSQLSENPDDITVLLTASTGVASFNIGGGTIHNKLSIGANVRLPYQPLSDDKINSLRTKLGTLQILIIDEVSMVDHRLLSYIHGRLRQIKQTGDYSLFGKVSILCVGDFYQLPPVKGTALYADTKGVNLWENNFELAELTKVVRQQDSSFAEMLNRLRVRKKNECLTTNDIGMLKKCESGEKCNDIHIFATNAEVDKYNIERLHECCPEAISINAQDYVKNSKTGRMERKVGFHAKVFNSSLSKCVSLGIGARVMLKKNIEVADGLVNGAFGTVVHISESQSNDNDFPSAIHVEFDDPNVGKIQRSKTRHRFSQNSTVIEVQEDQVTNDGGIRRQFPLRLAWACTVHKVQGLTVDRAVVSLKKIFTAGQAYVALSRVRSLSGLIIEDFKESAIFCNDKIELAMKDMPKLSMEKDSFTESLVLL
ncbi:uncharacterized protein LOC127964736 [Carassius gibelio]|uniref:uncharacterized protein LOC127964736 n=1 Tax=Carassius gibelio TaxID=101364 RepID=UPI0022794F10|nr:uncharacterized protein LOC127964736 [Carassius gibelio]